MTVNQRLLYNVLDRHLTTGANAASQSSYEKNIINTLLYTSMTIRHCLSSRIVVFIRVSEFGLVN